MELEQITGTKVVNQRKHDVWKDYFQHYKLYESEYCSGTYDYEE